MMEGLSAVFAVGPTLDLARLLSSTILRLCLAAFLGGVIGLERELHHKPAGLRTNMFICFGSAMFTILSVELAGEFVGDHTRIAAQIIPGIGFIGAGSILHSRGSVTGLTTAATLFVVASIGMAAGGGLYIPAIFATLILFMALEVLGWFETHFNLKPLLTTYEVMGDSVDHIMLEVNRVLEDAHKIMQSVQVARADSKFRIIFRVDGTRREQGDILRKLRSVPGIGEITCTGSIVESE
jgi:putative Mg2+ transporter-C (MgtC) family protein